MGNTMLSFFVTMGDTMTGKYICKVCCSEAVAPARYNLGYHSCLKCGQVTAGKRKFTVVPMHKSNYVVISNKKELKGINNKGGFYE
jgi:ribosomal protein L37AE/L43A